MRLAFDATSLIGARTGVGVFASEVLARLAGRPDLEVVAFGVTWRGRDALASSVPPGIRIVGRPMAARPLRQAWRRSDHPTVEHWTGRVDVVHGPNFVVPPTRHAAEVVTVHDLTCIRFPELCTPDTLEYPDLIRRAIRRGATIHTVSAFVGDEVRDAFGVPTEQVVVIPNGVRVPPPVGPGTDAAAGRALAGLGPEDAGSYLLAVGTVEPRKDLPLLVDAFGLLGSAMSETPLRLVIAGPDGWGAEALAAAIARSPVRDRIVRLGWVSDDQRVALLRGAAAMVFPSIYEGFGLPPLDAMATGTPVIATAAGAVPEVVGEAAVLVPPGDAEALADAIADVLDDPGLADRLRQRGHERVAGFDWDDTTDQLVALYRRLAAAR
ncbi:MAG: glycosyltransferase family 4 protein [Acidimicrobiales bacterium]